MKIIAFNSFFLSEEMAAFKMLCRFAWNCSRLAVCFCLWWSILIGFNCTAQTNLTLQWNASEGAGSYRIYSSEGTASFTLKTSGITVTSNTVLNVSTSAMTRFYVTAYNAAMAEQESPPSNTVTNTPTGTPIPPAVGTLVLSAPTFTKTNLIYGESFSVTATIRNSSAGALGVSDAWIVAVSPGGSQATGPWLEFTPHAGAKTLAAGASVSIPGSFTVPTNGPTGPWLAYLTAKDVGGAWLPDGIAASFTVSVPSATRLPAPTNLRAQAIGQGRIDIGWMSVATASTEVERAEQPNPFAKIATVLPGTFHFNDTSIRKHRDYAYRIRSITSFETSDYSNTLLFSSR